MAAQPAAASMCGLPLNHVAVLIVATLCAFGAGLLIASRKDDRQLFQEAIAPIQLPQVLPLAPSDSYHITLVRANHPDSGDYINQYVHTYSQHQCYALTHGYSFELDLTLYEKYDHIYKQPWTKVSAAIERMEIVLARRAGAEWTGGVATQARDHPLAAHEWIFSIDSDLVIQRMKTRLEEFFDPTGPYDVFLADHLVGDFNSGFVGYKANPQTLAFLKRVAAMQPRCGIWFTMDQGGLNQVILEMLQERLCSGDDRVLPPEHPACDKKVLELCITKCGDMSSLYPCYNRFRDMLPAGLWTYGNRTLLPWLHAYKYRGSDPDSPLVDFNRFFFHDAKFNPLSRPTDFVSHAKKHQEPYVLLAKQMQDISDKRLKRGLGETFCEALTKARP